MLIPKFIPYIDLQLIVSKKLSRISLGYQHDSFNLLGARFLVALELSFFENLVTIDSFHQLLTLPNFRIFIVWNFVQDKITLCANLNRENLTEIF